MRAAIVTAALIGVLGAAGCASSGEAPEWFAERSAENDSGYPSLRDVPRTTTANTNAAHWAAVEADLEAAGAAVKANPRSQPATVAEDPNAFLNEAREELDETRQAHEP